MKFIIVVALMLSTAAAFAQDTAIERGRYLVNVNGACTACHSADLGGGNHFMEFGASIHVPNISQDKATGIGAWTDTEIITAIRNGKRPDGSTIGFPMPIEMYRHMSDSDVMSVVVYLRTVAPVVRKIAKSTYPKGLPENYGPTVTTVEEVPQGVTVARGEYVARMSHCMACHTPVDEDFVSQFDTMLGAGGLEFPIDDEITLVTANLTPGGNLPLYSDEELAVIIRTGVRPDGTKLFPFMAFTSYKNFSNHDMAALILYLRSLKPVD